MRFNGSDYNPKADNKRLIKQHIVIKNLMLDGEWRTLSEIEDLTKYPGPSISAQLRHLRKKRFGSYILEKRVRGKREEGLFEYRLLPPNGTTIKSFSYKEKLQIAEAFIEARGLMEEYKKGL